MSKDNENQLLPSYFIIQYRGMGENTWKKGSMEEANVLNSTVSGLLPNMKYLFRVLPLSEYGGILLEGQPTPVSEETKTKCAGKVNTSLQQLIPVLMDCLHILNFLFYWTTDIFN